jgi:hypothetical protein
LIRLAEDVIERSISMSDTPTEEIKDETEDLGAKADVRDATDETIEEAEITDEDQADEDQADEEVTEVDEDEVDEAAS